MNEPAATNLDRSARFLAGIGAAFLGLGLVWAILALPQVEVGLGETVRRNLGVSGVSNPVTAVLLNFRGYDTMLEVGVLVLALIGSQALRGTGETLPEVDRDIVLDSVVRVLTPPLIIVAAYMLWIGGTEPGGAFQAGAILAAGAVILLLAGLRPPRLWHWMIERLAVIAGFLVFALAALACIPLTDHLLGYPQSSAKYWILAVEGVSALSIALILTLLFAGHPLGRGMERDQDEGDR